MQVYITGIAAIMLCFSISLTWAQEKNAEHEEKQPLSVEELRRLYPQIMSDFFHDKEDISKYKEVVAMGQRLVPAITEILKESSDQFEIGRLLALIREANADKSSLLPVIRDLTQTGSKKYVTGENAISTGTIESTWDLNPKVISVAPSSFLCTVDNIKLTISGDGFLEGAQVLLTGPDNLTPASVKVNSNSEIEATFNFSGEEEPTTGTYAVQVTNTTGRSGILQNAVEIEEE